MITCILLFNLVHYFVGFLYSTLIQYDSNVVFDQAKWDPTNCAI